MQKMKWMAGAAMMMAGAVSAELITIVIDRDYNSGNNIAEYSAWDTSKPWDGTADSGDGNFAIGTAAGVSLTNGTQLRRPAFFFKIPTGCTSAQIINATLKVRLNVKMNPTTALSIWSAATNTLWGGGNATYAKSMFSNSSFTDTGLGLATTATAGIHTFNVTSLVKAALDQNLSTTVVAFRFQMDNDTSFTYGTLSNYNIIGFDAETIGNRPALTLEVMPITVGLFNVPSGDLPFSRRLI